jgi:hypothetical protein
MKVTGYKGNCTVTALPRRPVFWPLPPALSFLPLLFIVEKPRKYQESSQQPGRLRQPNSSKMR